MSLTSLTDRLSKLAVSCGSGGCSGSDGGGAGGAEGAGGCEPAAGGDREARRRERGDPVRLSPDEMSGDVGPGPGPKLNTCYK